MLVMTRKHRALAGRWLLFLFLTGLCLAALQSESIAGRKKGGGSAIHGCVILRDFIADPANPLGPPFDDGIMSDGAGPYCDAQDFTGVGLGQFFNVTVKTKRNGGRMLELDFTDFFINGLDPAALPSEKNTNTWVLWVEGSLPDWRAQPLNMGVLRKGRLTFGSDGKGWAEVHFGAGGQSDPGDSDSLTVTRIAADLWVIEFLPVDKADVLGVLGSMPFALCYDGQD